MMKALGERIFREKPRKNFSKYSDFRNKVAVTVFILHIGKLRREEKACNATVKGPESEIKHPGLILWLWHSKVTM